MFSRVAVVNRGEPAVRLIRAVRELNEQYDWGIRVIALHTHAERRALFVRAADEAVCLQAVASPGGPYLDQLEFIDLGDDALDVSAAAIHEARVLDGRNQRACGFEASDVAVQDIGELQSLVREQSLVVGRLHKTLLHGALTT
jgi:hypothetical protein